MASAMWPASPTAKPLGTATPAPVSTQERHLGMPCASGELVNRCGHLGDRDGSGEGGTEAEARRCSPTGLARPQHLCTLGSRFVHRTTGSCPDNPDQTHTPCWIRSRLLHVARKVLPAQRPRHPLQLPSTHSAAGDRRQYLQHVVLQDVASGAGVLVEAAARADAQRLCDGDLHVVDPGPVPDRSKIALANRSASRFWTVSLPRYWSIRNTCDSLKAACTRSSSARALSSSWP